jgi:ribose transport system permease protein
MIARPTAIDEPPAGGQPTTSARALDVLRRVGPIWIAVILLYIVAGIKEPAMFKTSQMLNILQVAAFLGTVAIGQTIALLVGGGSISRSPGW